MALPSFITKLRTALDAANQALRSDPELKQLDAQLRSGGNEFQWVKSRHQLIDALKAKGFHVPDGFTVGHDEQGQPYLFDPQNSIGDMISTVAPIAIGAFGGAAGLAALSGAGAAPGVAAVEGGGWGVPGSVASALPGVAAVAPPLVNKAAGGGLWGAIAGTAIQAGTQLAGAKIATDASERAAQIQADAAQKALDFQRELYQQQRTDLAPYRAAGQGSINRLGYGLGISGFESGSAPAVPDIPTPPSSYSNMSKVAASPTTATPPIVNRTPALTGTTQGLVTMKAPDGSENTVPASLQSFYEGLGATVVR